MSNFINIISNDKGMKILIVVITFDVIFGVLRAIKERKLNSTIGIDGIIRKVGMMLSIICSLILDNILNIDLIMFIPSEIKEYIHITSIGISDLFTILYVVFEILSILKNMIRCKLPIPKKLQLFLEKILKEFTSEIKETSK